MSDKELKEGDVGTGNSQETDQENAIGGNSENSTGVEEQNETKSGRRRSVKKQNEDQGGGNSLLDKIAKLPDMSNREFVDALKKLPDELTPEKREEALALCLKFAGKTSKDEIDELAKRAVKGGNRNLSICTVTWNKTWDFKRETKIATLVMMATHLAERFILESAE